MSKDKLPKKLSDLAGRDLSGFQQTQAYYLELKHGLMGFFPAVYSASAEIIVCLDEQLLDKVLKLLPKRPYTKGTIQALVNPQAGYGFDSRNSRGGETQPFRILTAEEYQRLVSAEKKPFKWAPGLVGPGMNEDEFVDTLKTARKRK